MIIPRLVLHFFIMVLLVFYKGVSTYPPVFTAQDIAVRISPLPPTVLPRQVPVLCYHQVKDVPSPPSRSNSAYIIAPGMFYHHINMLVDSGYHFISPDQLTTYLSGKGVLPVKPILLSFDDGTTGQYSAALPILDKFGIKATFFIMTVVLNRPGYLSAQQVKQLSATGHTIGAHTWDHHTVPGYTTADWELQLEKPLRVLEKITGKPIKYFAYPNGTWNKPAIHQLKQFGVTAAFQLAGKQDPHDPLHTIRRIIAAGNWNEKQLLSAIKFSFK